MPVVGLVVEYNPFHNGHRYHLRQSRVLSGADAVVCAMSGNFLQRGEPAVLDKWHRAAMALAGGADVVFELPAAFATQSAETFAAGAVRLLTATGVVTHLSFGSEAGELAPLQHLSDLLASRALLLESAIRAEMQRGLPYPAARVRAVHRFLSAAAPAELAPGAAAAVLAKPNNILAIEYLKALQTYRSPLQPVTVARRGAGYHDPDLGAGVFASATAIRRGLQHSAAPEGGGAGVEAAVPPAAWAILQAAARQGEGPVFMEDYAPLILATLRRAAAAEIAAVAGVNEGLEHRLLTAARAAGSVEELLRRAKTKRYTWTRLQRILIHTVLGLTAADAAAFAAAGPQYLRVLGFSARGKEVLRAMRTAAVLPVIHRPAPALARPAGDNPDIFRRMLSFDALATDIYTLGLPGPAARRGGRDFTTPPVSFPAP